MLKRRREGRTDYRKRLKLLSSGKVRCVIRLTSRHAIVQFVEYREQKDFVLTGATSKELSGWNRSTASIPAAYLTGYLAGKKAKALGIDEAIVDAGFVDPRKNERLRCCIKGVIDSGVEMPFSLECNDDRIRGKHINTNVEELFNNVLKSEVNDDR
jgi:large subunit ribosomal protein L18